MFSPAYLKIFVLFLFNLQLRDVSGKFERKSEDFVGYVLVFPKKYDVLTKSIKEKMAALSRQFPGCRLMQTRFCNKEDFGSRVERACGGNLRGNFDFEADSVVFLAFGKKSDAVRSVSCVIEWFY